MAWQGHEPGGIWSIIKNKTRAVCRRKQGLTCLIFIYFSVETLLFRELCCCCSALFLSFFPQIHCFFRTAFPFQTRRFFGKSLRLFFPANLLLSAKTTDIYVYFTRVFTSSLVVWFVCYLRP